MEKAAHRSRMVARANHFPPLSAVACIRKAILIEYEMGGTWYVNGAKINTANRLEIFTCHCHHFSAEYSMPNADRKKIY